MWICPQIIPSKPLFFAWLDNTCSKSLINEGNYEEDLKEGEWKYYYPSYVKEDNTKEPFSNELYLIENYSGGKLNGKSTRFSRFEDEEYPCDETDENGNKIEGSGDYFDRSTGELYDEDGNDLGNLGEWLWD